MNKIKIFVSYSHEDARWFEEGSLMPRLSKSLELMDVEVWYDRKRLDGGDPWRQEIEQAIDQACLASNTVPMRRNLESSLFSWEIAIGSPFSY